MSTDTAAPEGTASAVSGRLWQGQTPDARQADRRQRLVEAGIELVGTQGVAALTMRAACREAAVGPRYFYDVFADPRGAARGRLRRDRRPDPRADPHRRRGSRREGGRRCGDVDGLRHRGRRRRGRPPDRADPVPRVGRRQHPPAPLPGRDAGVRADRAGRGACPSAPTSCAPLRTHGRWSASLLRSSRCSSPGARESATPHGRSSCSTAPSLAVDQFGLDIELPQVSRRSGGRR